MKSKDNLHRTWHNAETASKKRSWVEPLSFHLNNWIRHTKKTRSTLSLNKPKAPWAKISNVERTQNKRKNTKRNTVRANKKATYRHLS